MVIERGDRSFDRDLDLTGRGVAAPVSGSNGRCLCALASVHSANSSAGSLVDALVLGLLEDPQGASATAHARAVSAIRA
jgi:hypothetical protein